MYNIEMRVKVPWIVEEEGPVSEVLGVYTKG